MASRKIIKSKSRRQLEPDLGLLLLILITFNFSGLALANSPKKECSRWYTSIGQLLSRSSSNDNSFGTLHPFVKNWLRFNAEELQRYKLAFAVGDKLTVDGIACQVLAILGKGVEAPKGVFLVRTNDGLRVIKVFRNLDAMNRNLDSINNITTAWRNAEFDMKISKPLKVDRSRHIELMEYAEGVDVQNIRLIYNQFGLNKTESERIYAEWEKLRDLAQTKELTMPQDFNFTYNFKTQSFTLIDPH